MKKIREIGSYILERLDEFSTWIGLLLVLLVIGVFPKGLALFLISLVAFILAVLPDSKFSTFLKRIFGS